VGEPTKCVRNAATTNVVAMSGTVRGKYMMWACLRNESFLNNDRASLETDRLTSGFLRIRQNSHLVGRI